MSIRSLFGGRSKAVSYPSDTLTARDGSTFTITFFKHASLSLCVGGKYIYVDPVSDSARYDQLPKADLIIITHSHYDHLDRAAVEELLTSRSVRVSPAFSPSMVPSFSVMMAPSLSGVSTLRLTRSCRLIKSVSRV